jgi:hypothetical protein
VSIGWAPGLPVAKSDGSFVMPSVVPGKHDLTVRGPEFAETMVRDVVVASGQTKDIGTVKVKRGRNVSGRVLAADGKPVAGATVVLGDQIFGDGKSLASSSMAGFEDAMGLRKTTSDGDGRYFLRGIGDKQLVIAAEHESQGRSPVQTVSAGGGSAEIDLRLAGTGGVSGLVRAGGKPASGAQMIATATTSAKQNMMVTTGADGLYQFARLAAGQYKITAMLGGGLGGSMASRTVVVKPGQKSTVNIDIAVGDLALTVTIQPKSGTIDSAQIFLFDGAVSASTAKELQEKVVGGADSGAKVEFWMGGPPKTFKEVAAGVKSICVIPITGDLSDTTFQQRLQENMESLKAYCSRHEMKASPAAQSTTLTVPPMDPLPAPPSP